MSAFILLVLLPALTLGVAADYNVNVSNGGVTVKISGDLLQGVPNPPLINSSDPFGQIPVFNLHLEGMNASSGTPLATFLNAALREKTPAASTDQIVFDANSNGTNYHYSLKFDVTGISTSRADTRRFDLSWKSFTVSDDLKTAGYNVNTVLQTYLQSRILQLAQLSSSPPRSPITHELAWWWNGRKVDRQSIGALASDTSMLNFTSLTSPVENWKIINDLDHAAIHYEARAGFNLTFADRITEVGEVGTFWTNAIYYLKTTIDAPWDSVASGDILIIGSSTPWSTWLMLATIIISVVAFAAITFLERRFRGRPRVGRRIEKTRQ